MNYYYHLTQPEFVSTIQKEGLKPMLGKRSKSIGDKDSKFSYMLSLTYNCLNPYLG